MIQDNVSARPLSRDLRAAIFRLHAWVGLVFATLLCATFALGTLLVFGEEIDRAIYPQMRVSASGADPVSFGTAYDAAAMAHPELEFVELSRDPDGSVADRILAKTPQGRQVHVWIDPATGTANGTTPYFSLHRVLREIHSRYFVLNNLGLLAATSVSFLLALSLATGLVTYRRFWKGLFRLPARSAEGRAWWGASHRLLAVWSLPFLLVTCLTGMFYFAEVLGLSAALPPSKPATERTSALPDGFAGADLDRIAEVARQTYPDVEMIEMVFPTWRGAGIVVRGLGSAPLVRPRADAVTVDPVSFEVLGQHRGEDLSAARRVTEMADPLHFGTWGGTTSRILWLIFGTTATLLAASGATLCAQRLGREQARRHATGEVVAPRRLPALRWLPLIGATALVLGSGLFMTLKAAGASESIGGVSIPADAPTLHAPQPADTGLAR